MKTIELVLVEDDKDWMDALQGLYRKVFREAGYQVTINPQERGANAITYIESRPNLSSPCLISLDLNLGRSAKEIDGRPDPSEPGICGIEVLEAAEACANCLAAIVVTGAATDETIEWVFRNQDEAEKVTMFLDPLVHKLFPDGRGLIIRKVPDRTIERQIAAICNTLTPETLRTLCRPQNVFLRDGSGIWRVSFAKGKASVRDSKGMAWLRHLIRYQHQEMDVVDLRNFWVPGTNARKYRDLNDQISESHATGQGIRFRSAPNDRAAAARPKTFAAMNSVELERQKSHLEGHITELIRGGAEEYNIEPVNAELGVCLKLLAWRKQAEASKPDDIERRVAQLQAKITSFDESDEPDGEIWADLQAECAVCMNYVLELRSKEHRGKEPHGILDTSSGKTPRQQDQDACRTAIKRALKDIMRELPALAEHLNFEGKKGNVRLGTDCCCYKPNSTVDWDLGEESF